MDVGSRIAIAGVWLFAGISWHSERISAVGMWLALIVAILITTFLKV